MKKFISIIILFLFISLPSFSADTTVTISPTWNQAFQFANKSGQAVWTTIGIILLAASVLFITFGGKDTFQFAGIRSGLAVNFICAGLVALGLFAILNKPGAIKWNNDKVVNKQWLEYKGEKYIWDSLETNCLIVDGPKNCYTDK